MVICSCSHISDKDSKEEAKKKLKETKTNCKDCIFFKSKSTTNRKGKKENGN